MHYGLQIILPATVEYFFPWFAGYNYQDGIHTEDHIHVGVEFVTPILHKIYLANPKVPY
jgi:hypothetical protein